MTKSEFIQITVAHMSVRDYSADYMVSFAMQLAKEVENVAPFDEEHHFSS